MKSGTLAAIVIVVLLAVGGFLLLANGDDDPSNSDNTSVVQQSDTNDANETTNNANESSEANLNDEVPAQMISASQVAMHASEDDCWTIVNDTVYDITMYIPRHPGGDAILQACGTDGTSLFTQRQTDTGETVGSGTPHSTNAASQLEDFRIGELAPAQ